MGSATVANSVSLAVTTVVGLTTYDAIAGDTTIVQKTPINSSSLKDVPAAVGSNLNFVFECITPPSDPEAWSTTALPPNLTLTNTYPPNPSTDYTDSITGIPIAPGKFPVTITVWRFPSMTGSDKYSQDFNIYVLGFSTQPAATTTISSGSSTTLNCAYETTGKPAAATLTYEWYQGTSGTFGPILGTSASFNTPNLFSTTDYWVRIKSVLNGYAVYANSNTATVNITPVSSPFDTWASESGLLVGQRGATQTPQNDGVTNLEKFAFNLDPLAPDVRHLTVGANGTAGLPGGVVVGGLLRLEFLRRIAGTNPGITYTAQFGSDLAGWTDIPTGTPPGVAIDGTWERVTVDDPTGGTKRFGRVKVVQTP